MSRQITPEMIAALDTLLAGARGAYRVSPEVRDAINVLDNADFFTPITDARDELENAAPRTPIVIEEHGPLIQARDANGRIWSTATTPAKVISHLRELDTPFIIVSPEELGIPPLDPAEWGDTTREDMVRHQGA